MNQFMKHATLPTIYTETYFSVWAQAMQCLLSEVNDNFDNLIDFQTLWEIKKKNSNK